MSDRRLAAIAMLVFQHGGVAGAVRRIHGAADLSTEKMKTILLTDDDVVELRILRHRLETDFESEKRRADKVAHQRYSRSHMWTRPTTDKERDAVKAVEVLNRILK